MKAYIARRLLWSIVTVLGAVTIMFLIINILPGDIALIIVVGQEGGGGSLEDVARVREELGLNRPLYEQYFSWLAGVAHLDFGRSLWTGELVITEIGRRFPVSLQLVLMSVLISVVLAIPTGVLAALKQDTWVDYLLRSILIGGLSIPSFWFGVLIILFLVSVFNWFPPLEYANFFTDPRTSFLQLIFPALALGYRQTSMCARMMRSAMLEVVREDYVRTARAKGLDERAVIWRHIFRNAILPTVTIFGLELVVLFSGAVVIETVFNVPGIGSFLIETIHRRDIPAVQGAVTLIVLFVLAINLITDLVYAWLDPRIRYK